MSFVAVAIGGSALLGTAGSMISANGARVAQNRANDANAANAAATNALNKQMFDESRGSTGSAVLPTYLKAYEASLGEGAAKSAQAIMDSGGGSEARIRAGMDSVGRYMPLVTSGDNYLSSLYGGGLLDQRRASMDPVLAARTQAAEASANAINQSIYGNIGKMDAAAASKGFLGGSSFDRNRILMASIGSNLAAAQQRSGARLQNATDLNSLNESDVAMRMQNLNQPFSRASSLLSMQYDPLQKESALASNAMAPLSFFKLGQGAFQYQPMPTVQPVPSSGMIAGAGLGALGSALGSYGNMKMLTNALKPPGNPGGGYDVPLGDS